MGDVIPISLNLRKALVEIWVPYQSAKLDIQTDWHCGISLGTRRSQDHLNQDQDHRVSRPRQDQDGQGRDQGRDQVQTGGEKTD